ncbi:MAG: DNA recombination protein RmuC [Candidatus Sabulitectum sp.]|nr:DNA recombination protein RmuC [Candidatus Sabulitectum sp.]
MVNALPLILIGIAFFVTGWALGTMKAHGKKAEELESLRNKEREMASDLKVSAVKLVESDNSLSDMRSRLNRVQLKLDEKGEAYLNLKEEYARIETSLDEKQQHFKEQLDLLSENREALKKEFSLLAGEIFEKNGKQFKELNKETILSLLNPVEKEMKGFRERINLLHDQDSEQRTTLRTELINLQKLNKDITEQTNKLTTALQGQKKMQGNWGEMILENVLDSSGLRLGDDYGREVSYRTEDGALRPDVIVYLPGDRHLVIDAKTSLAAYTEFVNANDPAEAGIALSNHARAIGERIKELSGKDYFKIKELNSPEVVIMFIPIESAYVEALKYDPTLFQKAIENNVLVATPTTLLTSLNIVRQLWRFEDQTKHSKELALRAEKFYSKLRTFLISMKEIGSQIDKAQTTYHKAMGQLMDGNANLIKQAAEFRDLGVSVTRELPSEFVEKANLELEQGTITED